MKILTLLLCLCFTLPSLAQDKVKIACVGNSITYGMRLPNREKESYPVQLQQMLGEGYEVGNFGKSSATLLTHGYLPYIQQEEYKQALAFAGDIVVIHLGVNDTDPRCWPFYRDEFLTDYLNLIESFKKVNPKCRVIIARLSPIGVNHRRFDSGTREWREMINVEIEKVAKTAGVQLVDFEEPFYARPDLIPDNLHPNPEGAKLLARTVYSAITGDYGGLQMPHLYADRMVLQRDMPLTISGTANAGAKVEVSIDRQKVVAETNDQGKWSVKLLPLTAGNGYTLKVTDGKTNLQYRDVAVGEVWLCSGQSNMEFKMRVAATGKEDIPNSDNTEIRLFNMDARWRTDDFAWTESALDSVNALLYLRDNGWEYATPKSVEDFSAIAYYFGKSLHDSLNVPIGLICNAVGGSPTESWIDRRTLECNLPQIFRSWSTNDFVQDWVRNRGVSNTRNATAENQRHPYHPSYMFEAGILPLAKYPLRGVIWYQGESNAQNIETHERLFPMLVDSWRGYWDNPNLPFYYVQLSSMNRPSWCWFRDSQRRMLTIRPSMGMAVSSDVGHRTDVHPRMKKPVAERLARWALHDAYGHTNVVPSGPLFREAEVVDNAVYLSFDYGEGMRSSDNTPLRTFEVAGSDGIYHPAEASVVDGRVKVVSEEVAKPCEVRYGWQPFTQANLVNGEGLPASTFRTELPKADGTEVTVMQGKANDKNFAKGVSASLAGYTDGCLVVAGGCNFPKTPAAEGGKKVFYDKVYVLEELNDSVLRWREAGRLSEPLAYGVAVSTSCGIVCAGGTNADGAKKDAFILRLENGKAKTESLPSLPFTLDNMSGAAIGSCVYLVGGNRDGKPSNTLLRLDLTRKADGWVELAQFPGNPRTQAVCAAQLDGNGRPTLYVWGGFAAKSTDRNASLNTDGLAYSPITNTWQVLPAVKNAEGVEVSLGGGTAVAVGDSLVLCTGGVNKDIFLAALQQPAPDYMTHPAEWYKFNNLLLIYNTRSAQWQTLRSVASTARAGAAIVSAPSGIYNINGELKPGVRSPKVSKIRLDYQCN